MENVDGQVYRIDTLESLTSLYPPAMHTLIAKEQTQVTSSYARLIESAPLAIIATRGPQGLDCSPRGDGPGFLTVLDEKTLLLPDRRGNNRLDTLTNLLHDDSIALLLLIPGIGETVRIRGKAIISTDPKLIKKCQAQGPDPISVMVITVSKIYFQCQRALVRSKLWSTQSLPEANTLPSAGDLLAEADAMSAAEAEIYDQNMNEYVTKTLYER